MAGRKKKAKTGTRSAKKKPARRRAKKLGRKAAGKKVVAAASSHPYTFEQLAYMFWASFGQGAGLPVDHATVIDEGKAQFATILQGSIDDGTFDQESMVEETKQCCVRAGEIATSAALFRKHTKIQKNDFLAAIGLLRDIMSGGQGGLC